MSKTPLQAYLDDLNTRHELLSFNLESQHMTKRPRPLSSEARQLVAEWRAYLNHKLPRLATPGAEVLLGPAGLFVAKPTAPEYADGPLGWRQFYADNRDSSARMGSADLDRVQRWGKEYQGKLRKFHQRFVAAGGESSQDAPAQPDVSELPKATEPVWETPGEAAAEGAAIVTEAVADTAGGALQGVAKGLGISRGTLIGGAALAAAGVAAIVASRFMGSR